VWPCQDKPRGSSNAPTRHHVWHLAAARWELYYQPFEAAIDVGAGAVPFRKSGGKLGMLHKVEENHKIPQKIRKVGSKMGQTWDNMGQLFIKSGTKCRFTNHLLSWNGICMTQDWLVFGLPL